MTKAEKRLLPHYFRGKFQLISTVTFTAFFSLAFMMISIPFTNNAWFELRPSRAFAFTAVFFAISLLVLIISRRVMYATRRLRMTYFQYVLWILTEVLIICLLYTAFTIQGDELGIIDIEEDSFLDLMGRAWVYAFTSLIVPNIIAGMYFAILDKNKTLRVTNYKDVVSDQPASATDIKKINLFDNAGVLKLSVNLSHLYYIESDDNYVNVWYSDSKNTLAKYMIRARLKAIEESFKDTMLVRCHRKYLVNIGKVSVLRHGAAGYELVLDNDEIPPIPVSKTYEDQVLKEYPDA